VNAPVNAAATTFDKVNGRLRNISLSGAHIIRKLGEDVGIEWCEFAPRAVKDLLRANRAQS
jgi:hypothetical protein